MKLYVPVVSSYTLAAVVLEDDTDNMFVALNIALAIPCARLKLKLFAFSAKVIPIDVVSVFPSRLSSLA